MNSSNKRFVFSGGPGAGKTAVLDALAAAGVKCVPEAARMLIRQRLDAGLSPRPEAVEFAREIFNLDVANYMGAPADEVTIFDRSVVDALAMRKECGDLSDQELASCLDRYGYNRLAFLFPPWQDIYRQDDERDQTFAESVAVFDSLKSWYVGCGYQVVDVPCAAVEERCWFVQQLIDQT